MSLERWLAEREPAPPAELAERLRSAVAEHEHLGGEMPERLLAIAESMLRGLLDDGCGERREAALDLLTADAIVTYALEAASEQPERLEERASSAMRRIAALAAAPAR